MSANAIYWILFGAVAILSYVVQASLQSKFAKYSKVGIANGMTGADVARKMLADNGITDVSVTHVPGQLTDNYNPVNKTLNLSDVVYGTCSVAAAAVAAHECGHALQIKYATAITCHKSQGGQWDCVFIDNPFWKEPELDDLKWLYTAITRGVRKVYFVNFKDEYFEKQ